MDADKRRSSTGNVYNTSLLSGFLGKLSLEPSTGESSAIGAAPFPAGVAGATSGDATGGIKTGGLADKFSAAGAGGYADSAPRRLAKTTDLLGASKPVGTGKQRRFSTGTQPSGGGGGADNARSTVMRSYLFNPTGGSIPENPGLAGAPKLGAATTNLTGNASISSIAAGMVSGGGAAAAVGGEKRKKRGMRDLNAMTPMNW